MHFQPYLPRSSPQLQKRTLQDKIIIPHDGQIVCTENMRYAFTFETIAAFFSDYKEENTCIKNNKVHFIFEVKNVGLDQKKYKT